MAVAKLSKPLTITLTDGHAENMGGGIFVVGQIDENGERQSVCLVQSDLEILLAACSAPEDA